jgi:hypothetical protein
MNDEKEKKRRKQATNANRRRELCNKTKATDNINKYAVAFFFFLE